MDTQIYHIISRYSAVTTSNHAWFQIPIHGIGQVQCKYKIKVTVSMGCVTKVRSYFETVNIYLYLMEHTPFYGVLQITSVPRLAVDCRDQFIN